MKYKKIATNSEININEGKIKELANAMGVDLKSIKDEYKNIEYVVYDDLDDRYDKTLSINRLILYEGKISYYDKYNKLVKSDDNTKEILCFDRTLDIVGAGVYDNKYLIDPFGKVITEGGFYHFDDKYYFVDNDSLKVVISSEMEYGNYDEFYNNLKKYKLTSNKLIYDNNNNLVKNSICRIKNDIYLTDINGKIVQNKGIHKVSNEYDEVLHMAYTDLSGKVKIDKGKFFYCYVNDDGKVETNKFINYNDKMYFAKGDGKLLCDDYTFTGLYFNEDCEWEDIDNKGTIDVKEFNYARFISFFKFRYNPYKYTYKKENGDEISSLVLFDAGDVYVYDEENNLVKNKLIVSYNERKEMYYADDEGKLIRNQIKNIDGKDYLFSNNYTIVCDTWLYDYESNMPIKNIINPYISRYEIDRSLVDKYKGYYVMPTGEILKEDININYCNSNNYFWTYKNKTYDGRYDDNISKLGTPHEKDGRYVYDEVFEGVFTYVHKYKNENNNFVEIDNDKIDDQVKNRYDIENKLVDVESEIVYMGHYPINDYEGKVKEKIPWIIYKKEENEAFLVSYYAIVKKAFDKNGNNRWDKSELRKWLNDDFLNTAFSDDERNKIVKKNIETIYCSRFKETIETEDFVFLISSDEALDLNKKSHRFKSSKYAAKNTDPYRNEFSSNFMEMFAFRSLSEKRLYRPEGGCIDGDMGGFMMMQKEMSVEATKECALILGMWVRYE